MHNNVLYSVFSSVIYDRACNLYEHVVCARTRLHCFFDRNVRHIDCEFCTALEISNSCEIIVLHAYALSTFLLWLRHCFHPLIEHFELCVCIFELYRVAYHALTKYFGFCLQNCIESQPKGILHCTQSVTQYLSATSYAALLRMSTVQNSKRFVAIKGRLRVTSIKLVQMFCDLFSLLVFLVIFVIVLYFRLFF